MKDEAEKIEWTKNKVWTRTLKKEEKEKEEKKEKHNYEEEREEEKEKKEVREDQHSCKLQAEQHTSSNHSTCKLSPNLITEMKLAI